MLIHFLVPSEPGTSLKAPLGRGTFSEDLALVYISMEEIVMRMSLLLVAALTLAGYSAPAAAQKSMKYDVNFKDFTGRDVANTAKCGERIRKAGCAVSNNDIDRIEEHTKECKQLNAKNLTLETFLLKDSGKVVIVKTRDDRVSFNRVGNAIDCPRVKYDVGPEINDILISSGKVFLLSDEGSVFVLLPQGTGEYFFEVLKSNKNSYKGVKRIKGANGGNAVQFLDANNNPMQVIDGKDEVSMEEIEDLVQRGRMRPISFVYVPTNRSLFRDE